MLQLTAIPALQDNYIWCLYNNQQAWVVDPGETGPVEIWLKDKGLSLAAVFVTHHHPDHTAGIAALTQMNNQAVYGPATARFPMVNESRVEGDIIQLTPTDSLLVWEVPGHTRDHLAYVLKSNGATRAVFCGDTLFSAGCGRLFEGHPERMLASLKRLATLPDNTLVCCTHEYTLSNLKFAAAVLESGHKALAKRLAESERLRHSGKPTLPVTIGEKKQYNPFLMAAHEPLRQRVQSHCGLHLPDELAVFTELRRWKDGFG